MGNFFSKRDPDVKSAVQPAGHSTVQTAIHSEGQPDVPPAPVQPPVQSVGEPAIQLPEQPAGLQLEPNVAPKACAVKAAKVTDSLSDAHLVRLSESIASEDDLVKLGVTGLKLPYNKIKTAVTNHPKDIQSAVHDVLHTWLKQQRDRQTAFTSLYAALEECDMRLLATELQEWVPGAVGNKRISPQRLEHIQLLTKQSLRTKPFCLAVSKDWTLSSSKTDLREIYTDLSWTRKHRKAYNMEQEDLKNITQILSEEQMGEDGPVRILVKGKGGIGKSTAMKHLAISWAEGTVEELNKFHFLFHISLKHVKDDSYIENIIIAQHSGLKANKVKPAEIKSILEGDTDSKVLLLIDGHDEYKTGCNTDIDDAIKKDSLWNCWVILTSRETEDIKKIQEYMDAEAEIRGFDTKRIETYITKVMPSKEVTAELLQQAANSGLCAKVFGKFVFKANSILTVPILLNMVCILFLSNNILPSNVNGIMQAIVDRCFDREAIRAKGQKAVDSAKRALFNLGKLAWQGLNEPGKRLIFEKEEVIHVAGKEALELGLLFGTERMCMQEEETHVLCFPHLLLQEFAAAKHVSELDKADLEIYFPTWESIRQNAEVIKFAIGLSSQPDALIEVSCDRLASYFIQNGLDTRANYLALLKSVLPSGELPETATVDPFHNRFVNYISSSDTSEFIESKVYIIKSGKHSRAMMCRVEDAMIRDAYVIMAEGEEELTCVVTLLQQVRKHRPVLVRSMRSSALEVGQKGEDAALKAEVSENAQLLDVLRTLHEIRKHQEVSISKLPEEIICNKTVPPDLLKNLQFDKHITSVSAYSSKLSNPVVKHIIHQLRTCEKLEELNLVGILDFPYLGEALSKMTSLKKLNMFNCHMTSKVSRAVMSGVSHCCCLVELDLRNNTLTDYLVNLLGEPNTGFPSLESLILDNTKLSSRDLRVLSKAATDGKIPRLKSLWLSYNQLTGSLVNLLKEDFSFLVLLRLLRTDLSRADVVSLSDAAGSGKLPRLEDLYLSGNTLSGLVHLLVDHTVFTSLKTLFLENTKLTEEDIESLSDAVQSEKLPKLKQLCLDSNNLNTMEEAVESFIQTCVKHVKDRELVLRIGDNSLSEHLMKRMNTLCEGSSVRLVWSYYSPLNFVHMN